MPLVVVELSFVSNSRVLVAMPNGFSLTPVQGAFTYAIGPNPGPAPRFQVPSIDAGATSPQLLAARWIMFLSVMIAIGCSSCASRLRDR